MRDPLLQSLTIPNQFMHNGSVEEFSMFKRRLQQQLSDEIFNVVNGNTDSEWSFALFLSKVRMHISKEVMVRQSFTAARSQCGVFLSSYAAERHDRNYRLSERVCRRRRYHAGQAPGI